MTEEDKLFKSPEEKKREEKLAEEKTEKAESKAGEKGEAKEAASEEKAKAQAAVANVAKKEAAEKEAKKEKEKKKKADAKEKKREVVLQRVLVVPLGAAYAKPISHRVRVANRLLRAFVAKHLKAPLAKTRIAPELNAFIRVRGDRKPAKSVRVNASKDKDGVALAELAK